ncbi:MAG TPA: preprotein translocase subunit YajC [Pseudonocardia sp.]|jgi:preprotein translocase subunit YajC
MDISLLFPIIIVLLFIPIFLNGRKQRRQVTEMQQLQQALTEGDVVTTTSGLRGTVVDSSYEETLDLEIAPGVVTTWLRAAVREKVKPTDEAHDEGHGDEHGTDGATGSNPAGSNPGPSTNPATPTNPASSTNPASPAGSTSDGAAATDAPAGERPTS